MHFMVAELRVVHVNKSSQLIAVFLAFPVLTSAYLTSSLARDVVLFLDILPIYVFFPNTPV